MNLLVSNTVSSAGAMGVALVQGFIYNNGQWATLNSQLQGFIAKCK